MPDDIEEVRVGDRRFAVGDPVRIGFEYATIEWFEKRVRRGGSILCAAIIITIKDEDRTVYVPIQMLGSSQQ